VVLPASTGAICILPLPVAATGRWAATGEVARVTLVAVVPPEAPLPPSNSLQPSTGNPTPLDANPFRKIAERANQDVHLTAGTPAVPGLAATRPALALFGPGLPPYNASSLGCAFSNPKTESLFVHVLCQTCLNLPMQFPECSGHVSCVVSI
jgi:hypothetical protein